MCSQIHFHLRTGQAKPPNGLGRTQPNWWWRRDAGVAHPLAEAYIQTQLARLMNQKAGWLFDRGLNAAEASNMAKHAAARAALAASVSGYRRASA